MKKRKKMKKSSLILSIVAMFAFSLATVSCGKEQDLSGYMTREEWEAWQQEHENELSNYVTREEFENWVAEFTSQLTAYMTHEEFQTWLNTLANDLSSFMTTEEFQSWLAAHAHDLDGYMTQTEFQAWLLELAEDLSEYMTLAEFQSWISAHANIPTDIVSVYYFNITFPTDSANYVTATYNGLVGQIDTNDVVLVYANTNLGGWTQLPWVFAGGVLQFYRADSGVLTFSWGNVLNIASAQGGFTASFKALVVPETVYNNMVAMGVDHSSYSDVVRVYGLEQTGNRLFVVQHIYE